VKISGGMDADDLNQMLDDAVAQAKAQ